MSIINDVLVDKLFKDPPKRTKEIPLLSEKTVSGDGMLVINDAYSDFPIKNLTLQGNTKQESTTGKNLFDVSKATVGRISPDNGVILPETSYIVSDYIEVEEGGTYFQSGDGDGYYRAFYDAEKRFTSIPLKGNFKIIVPEGSRYLRISGLKETVSKWQIEKGDKATQYEPYTGGKPSPSPDYPQEIKNVGKWNEETQKCEVDVRVTGKNLFNKELVRNAPIISYRYVPIRVGKGAKVSVSYSKQLTTGLGFYVLISKDLGSPNTPYVWLYHSSVSNNINNKYTFTAINDVISLSFTGDLDLMFENIFTDLQIEISDAPTEYEPYKEQTLTITSDRPITKWDKLVEQDGQIGWLYGSRRYIVTGNEDFQSTDGYNIESYTNRFFILNDLLVDKDTPKPLGYMKCLRNIQYVYSPNIFEEGFETNQNQFHIKFLNERVGISASDEHVVRTLKYSEYIKNIYKSGEPIEILYATTNKEFIPLPKEEQDAIRALTTYYPTTVITVDGGELPVGIEVTYMKPEYIPTKQSALRMWFKENPII